LKPSVRCGLRLNPFPDAADRGLGQSAAFGHLLPRPVGGVFRGRFQGRYHDVLDLFGGDRGFASRARFVDQTVQPGLDEPAPPLTHRRHRNTKLRGDFLVRQTSRAGQNDPRAQRQSLRRLPPPNQPLQLLVFTRCQLQQRFRSSSHDTILSHDNETQAQDTSLSGQIRPYTADERASRYWRRPG